MTTITSQIVHLASDAYGDHLATVGGSPSNGDERDAMRAALEVAAAAWKKSLPEHQSEMQQAREVLNRVIIPDAAPVEVVNKAISEIVEGLAKIVNLPVDDQERIAREPLMGLVVFIREAWQVVAQSHRALVCPSPTAEQAKVVAHRNFDVDVGVSSATPWRDGDAGLSDGEMAKRGYVVQRAYAAPVSNLETPLFQTRVSTWMEQCFIPSQYSNVVERGDRLLEEVLELLQATGYDRTRVATLVDYVFGRPVGEPAQEVGGVMVTLAAFCWVTGLDMHADGARELARINQPDIMAKLREKQAAKNARHVDTPLPGLAPEVQS